MPPISSPLTQQHSFIMGKNGQMLFFSVSEKATEITEYMTFSKVTKRINHDISSIKVYQYLPGVT